MLATQAGAAPILSNAWVATGDLAVPRSGASLTLLADGSVLAIGGLSTGAVPTATVERYVPGSRTWIPAAPMGTARTRHSASRLSDGRVLVAGGVGSNGSALSSAEVYDPVSHAWQTVGSLHVARSGQAAVELTDGRVALVGGTSGGVVLASIEVFDPTTGVFTRLLASLSAARNDHAATLLGDGTVLVAGGTDGRRPLKSIDLFDPIAGTVSAGPTLARGRYGLSATTLLDGRVLIAGGTGTGGDLQSAEVFDPVTRTLAPTATLMVAARTGHQAILLPHNNQVLLVGGSAAGVAVPSAEVYVAWQGQGGSFFGTNAPATAGRVAAASTALSVREGLTVRTGPTDGQALVAGGGTADGAGLTTSAEVYGFATVTTDKADYAPGTPVAMTGIGWVPGETVTLTMVEEPLLDVHPPMTAIADASGRFAYGQWAPDVHDLNVRFTLTATGSQSQAQTVFTDARAFLGVALVALDKVYDGTATEPDASLSCTLAGVAPVDLGNVTCQVTGGVFDSANVGARTVTATVALGGPAAGNYRLATNTHVAPAAITSAAVTPTVRAADKTYDASTVEPDANLRCALSGVIGADSLTCVATAGAFDQPGVGVHAVTATVSLAGTAAANYTLGSPGTSLASTTVTTVVGAPGPAAVSADMLAAPAGTSVGAIGTALDTAGNLYVVDAAMSRVLVYAAGSTAPSVVYGQGGSFATGTINKGGISADSLNTPAAAAVDRNGNLYVADSGNNRVLFFPAGSTTATVVYGQAGDLTSSLDNAGGISASSLSNPSGVAVDANDNLYISDTGNNRVLFYAAGSTVASRVYGQAGAFVSNTANAGGISASSLSFPAGLTLDASGRLYVADLGNSRVLAYAAGNAVATTVYGQFGDFTTDFSNNGGVSAQSLAFPLGVAVDGEGSLYVADLANSRVLAFPAGSTTAMRVYGQFGNFTSGIANLGGAGPLGLSFPSGVAVDANGSLFVADNGNERTVRYQAGMVPAGPSITTADVSATLSAADRAYDGTTVEPDANMTCALTGVIAADLASVSCAATNGMFDGPALGAHTVTATVSLAGAAAGNYTFGPAGSVAQATTATASAAIAAAVTASLTVADKAYDGTTTAPDASLGCVLAGVLPADAASLSCVASGGQFDGANAGAHTVTATASLVGLAAPNYRLSSAVVTAPAAITTVPLAVVLRASNKTYDGTTDEPAGSLTCQIFGVVGQDDVSCAAGAGVFDQPVAGPRSVTATVALAGTTAGNYTLGQAGTSVASAAVTTFLGPVIGTDAATDMIVGTQGTSLGAVLVATDASGLYASDWTNHRVLFYPTGSTTPTRVYGQNGDFAAGLVNNGGVTADSLSSPTGVALDSAGNLYVGDYGNSRVLFYPAGSTTATRVYGQGGSFATNVANNSGISADSLAYPAGLAIDASDNLYVADAGNSRVLMFPAGSTTAVQVYGQGGSFTSAGDNVGGLTADSLAFPLATAVDATGRLYVADYGNNRVLTFEPGSTTATRVYGQFGGFTSSAANNGGVSASGLASPFGIALDGNGNLYVADGGNSRVLVFNTSINAAIGSPSLEAVQVYGQHGSFTTNTADYSGLSTSTLALASGVAVDAAGSLFVADYANNRILRFAGAAGAAATAAAPRITTAPLTVTLTAADKVYDATTIAPDAGLSCALTGVLSVDLGSVTCTATAGAFDGAAIGAHTVTATVSLGGSAAGNYTLGAAGTSVAAVSATAPASIVAAATPVTVTLVAADKVYDATTVEPDASLGCSLVGVAPADVANVTCVASAGAFDSPAAGLRTVTATVSLGGISAHLYSLASLTATASATITTASVAPTVRAAGKTYDGTVAESDANLACTLSGVIGTDDVTCVATAASFDLAIVGVRAVSATVDLGGTTAANYTFGAAGTSVASAQVTTLLGFADALADVFSAPAGTLFGPVSTAADAAGNLYVADGAGNRVLFYPVGSPTPTRVYGQRGSFLTGLANNGGVSADSLNAPAGVAVDGNGNLYVADSGNSRVLMFAGASTTAVQVYGQGGSFTTNLVNNGGISADSLSTPSGVAVDISGNLYVADTGNSRVLGYRLGQTTASLVYGQGGNFATGVDNLGGISADSLAFPMTVAVDASSRLYVADYGNSRVLSYPAGSTTAAGVYGQGGSFTAGLDNNGGVTAGSLAFPFGVAVDALGNLFVADGANSRVLVFTPDPLAGGQPRQDATLVFGQLGSFTSNTANSGGLTSASLSFPAGVTVDTTGALYVADFGNSRVLRFAAAAQASVTGDAPRIGTAAVTATLTAADKVFDGTTAEPDASLACSVIGVIPADAANVTCTATAGLFDSAVVGVHGVTATVTLSGTAAANYTLGTAGSTVATAAATTSASITGAPLPGVTATLTAADKLYDGTATAPDASLGCTLNGIAPADAANVSCVASGGAFDSAVAGARTVTATVTLSGPAAGAYALATPTATASAAITRAPVVVTLRAAGKTYDSDVLEADANLICSLTGAVPGDQVSCTATAGSFDQAVVGTRTVTAFVSLAGAAAGNYTMGAAGTTVSADIITTQLGAGEPLGTVIGGPAGTSFGPVATAVDGNGNLYVSDGAGHRVLFYPAGASAPTRVYGQQGSLTSTLDNNGGISADSMSSPSGIALDAVGNLYVADYLNSRVLFYPAGSTTATRVYGQGGSFTSAVANNGGITADSLSNPAGVAVDASDNLYVADSGNSRVLMYSAGSTTATRVYGQAGSFVSDASAVVSENSLAFPLALALDASDNLYVADYGNSRVLFYPAGTAVATRVYGQGGRFTTGLDNNGGVSAGSLAFPQGLAVRANRLHVADTNNSRVLVFSTDADPLTGLVPLDATLVLGQQGSFATSAVNLGGLTPASLSFPTGTALDGIGTLYVADYGNGRVLAVDAAAQATAATAAPRITTAPLVATLTAANKGFDGTTAASAADLSCTLAGVFPADAADVACMVDAGVFDGAAVGTHTVTATVRLSGAAAGNYTLGPAGTTAATGTATATASIVTPTPVTATLTAEDKVYDGTPAAPDANLTCTVSGLNPADAAHVNCVASAGAFDGVNAGPHTVTATVSLVGTGASLYAVVPASVSAQAAILQAPASVTADTKVVALGDPLPALSATVVGAVGAERLAYTLASTATATSPLGSYPVTVTLGDNPNYTVTATDGSLTITAGTTPVMIVPGRVATGGAIRVTVANGPGSVLEELALYCPSTSADQGYLDRLFLNGSTMPPAAGVASATVAFTAPTRFGSVCEVRWFARGVGGARLATSAPVTVDGSGPWILVNERETALSVEPGGELEVEVGNGPATRESWVNLVPTGAAARTLGDYQFLNGRNSLPEEGTDAATLNFRAPTVPGTYVLQFYGDTTTWALLTTSAVVTVTQPNLAPKLSGISPSSVVAGSGALTLTVTGSNFVRTSMVYLDGTPRATTYVSPTSVTAVLLASDVANGGVSPDVTVGTPAPGGGMSAPIELEVTGPTVTVPPVVALGGALRVTVAGGPRNPGDQVALYCPPTLADGLPTDARYMDGSTQAPAVGFAGATVGFTAPLVVGATCEARWFANGVGGTKLATSSVVSVSGDAPWLTVNGGSAVVEVSAGAEMTVAVGNGPGLRTSWVGLVPTAADPRTLGVYQFLNGQTRLPSTGATGATLTFRAPTTPGTYEFRFFGDTSSWQRLATSATVVVTGPNPTPTVGGVKPATVTAGSGAFTLTVIGTGFVPASSVYVDGAARVTTYVSPTVLTAVMEAGDIAQAGVSVVITVGSPTPGGGMSGAAALAVKGPTLIAPPTVGPGGAVRVTVAGGPSNPGDQVALYCPAGLPDGMPTEVQFMDGSTQTPAFGRPNATLTFTAPMTVGQTCEVRWLANAGFGGRLAVSAPITVAAVAPGIVVNGLGIPLTVEREARLVVEVANGPGTRTSWVTLVPVGAEPRFFSADYQFLNGETRLPEQGSTRAVLRFEAPEKPGTYEFRFFSDTTGWTRIATSATITVR